MGENVAYYADCVCEKSRVCTCASVGKRSKRTRCRRVAFMASGVRIPPGAPKSQPRSMSPGLLCFQPRGIRTASTGAPRVRGDVRAWSGGEKFRRKLFERLTRIPPGAQHENTALVAVVFVLWHGAECGALCERDSKGNSGTHSAEWGEFPGPREENCGNFRALGRNYSPGAQVGQLESVCQNPSMSWVLCYL